MERNIIECGGFFFIHNFDSGNLGHVERVPTDCIVAGINHKTNSPETPDYEFNLWTRPDCAGTEFENGNRTWFYFGIQAPIPNCLVRLNLINLNKQGKMYNQGMAPVTRTLPGKPHWERIRDRPIHSTDENMFTLSFKYRTSENVKATTFFAFTYPYSYAELQIALNTIDSKILPMKPPQNPDDIYYCRECLIYSLEGRRVDLLTISSHHGITKEREERLKNLFPEKQERPFKFQNKKVIFVSARVHPGETPSSFVFNGFLNLLLNKTDPVAIQLRKIYVFKLIPFLNPDGVARGHYRTDTRGVNLNRVYLNPSLLYHPTVYASRALIRYYHYGCEKDDSYEESCASTKSIQNVPEDIELFESNKDKKKSAATRSSDVRKRQTKSAGTDQREDNLPPFRRENVSSDLTGQVYDLKLNQEIQCQTSESSFVPSPPSDTTTSCLTDDALRTCLGSSVHVSTSEELNLQGGNPLRPLRDTLKNSISLLMESGTTVTGDSSMVSRVSGVRVGWCAECRRAAARLDAQHPPALPHPASVTTQLVRPESPTVYHSIEEYRDRQQQKFLDDQDIKTSDKPQVYFCTNCFKRYYNNEDDEHWWRNAETGGSAGSPGRTPSATGDSPPPPPLTLSTTPTTIQHGTEATSTVCPATGSRTNRPTRPAGPAPRRKTTHPATTTPSLNKQPSAVKEPDSGLYLYLDLHGHASKKGIFMYGNHFPDVERSVECMLLPRLMSLNNLHFHFSSCNFTERNMYLKDRRDGMSREGSGRVAVLKATGLVRSYTLECNYNTGRLVNVLPPPRAAPPALAPPPGPAHAGSAHTGPAHPGPAHAASPDTHHPPNYNPHIYEEARNNRYRAKFQNLEVFEEMDPSQVGKSLGASILDLTGSHPNSRVPSSEHRTVGAIREWLRAHSRTLKPQFTMSRLRPKILSPTRAPLYPRCKAKMPEERKENAFSVGREPRPIDSSLIKLAKKTDSKPPSRFLSENEPKVKSMTSKRRSILAIRKPNTSKTQVTGVVKKCRGRSETVAGSSSSSSGSTRRRPPHSHHAPNALKKIRLNTSA